MRSAARALAGVAGVVGALLLLLQCNRPAAGKIDPDEVEASAAADVLPAADVLRWCVTGGDAWSEDPDPGLETNYC